MLIRGRDEKGRTGWRIGGSEFGWFGHMCIGSHYRVRFGY